MTFLQDWELLYKHWPLTCYRQWKQMSNCDTVLTFTWEQGLTFQSNCLQKRQSEWNVKLCFHFKNLKSVQLRLIFLQSIQDMCSHTKYYSPYLYQNWNLVLNQKFQTFTAPCFHTWYLSHEPQHKNFIVPHMRPAKWSACASTVWLQL